MSFFKKLKDEFKEMMGDDKDKKDEVKTDAGSLPPGTKSADVGPPPQQHYGEASQYGQQYPQQQYGGPPSGPPQLPPGWTQQWDAQSQRWYYVEQATGRSQWDPPSGDRGFGHAQPPQPGYGYSAPHQYGQPQGYGQGYPSHDPNYAGTHAGGEKKKGGHGAMLAAGAGGLAVGALAGHALADGSSSDEEGHSSAPMGYGAPAATAPAGYGAPPPTGVPLEDNPELSSSQRSSLEEAREEYEEAQKEVEENSSASSSDVEELQEAREEYEEEIEDANEELED